MIVLKGYWLFKKGQVKFELYLIFKSQNQLLLPDQTRNLAWLDHFRLYMILITMCFFGLYVCIMLPCKCASCYSWLGAPLIPREPIDGMCIWNWWTRNVHINAKKIHLKSLWFCIWVMSGVINNRQWKNGAQNSQVEDSCRSNLNIHWIMHCKNSAIITGSLASYVKLVFKINYKFGNSYL